MKFVVFGLTVSSSWGNGHATLWRGLCSALRDRGHKVVFFEKDVPYYAQTRDLFDLPGNELIFYDDWASIQLRAIREVKDADVAMVTSYCPDALAATECVIGSDAGLRCFYDMDTPVTLQRLSTGQTVDYVGPGLYRDFDLVLSYSGGASLDQLRYVLEARHVAPLFGSVDPAVHKPSLRNDSFCCDLSYLGTASSDRISALNQLFIEPASQAPDKKFILAGSMYDETFPWRPNVFYLGHLPSQQHSSLYCSSLLNLNVTRGPMAVNGYCPSGRLFEAAACGAAVITDDWPGIERFFTPGEEILIARNTEEVLEALALPKAVLHDMAGAARDRALREHTSAHRAAELEQIVRNYDRTPVAVALEVN